MGFVPHIDLPQLPGIVGLLVQYPQTGGPLSSLAEALLRGPSSLSPADREAIAAYVSARNECAFCAGTHGAVARHLDAAQGHSTDVQPDRKPTGRALTDGDYATSGQANGDWATDGRADSIAGQPSGNDAGHGRASGEPGASDTGNSRPSDQAGRSDTGHGRPSDQPGDSDSGNSRASDQPGDGDTDGRADAHMSGGDTDSRPSDQPGGGDTDGRPDAHMSGGDTDSRPNVQMSGGHTDSRADAHMSGGDSGERRPGGQRADGLQRVDDMIANGARADVGPRLRALLAIAEKVRIDGRSVSAADVARARAAGADDKAIHDTVLIAAAFCMLNRYVDGLATVALDRPEDYMQHAKPLAAGGYLQGPPPRS
jgi:AhpD family alkylhydroperoxidase